MRHTQRYTSSRLAWRLLATFGLALALLIINLPTAQTATGDIAFQSFEETAPANAWNYQTLPAPYGGDPGGSQNWISLPGFTAYITAPSEGSLLWGMRNLFNGGGDFDHTLTFDSIDVSACTNVQVLFDYNIFAYDGNEGDQLSYEVTLDGTGQGVVNFVPEEEDFITDGWVTESVSVADSVNSVSLQLIARQRGAVDFAAWDNIRLTGDCATAPTGTTVFINELHYDNFEDDQGEFVEIAGPAGTDLTGYSLALYNGNSNALSVYNTVDLSSETIDDEGNGYGAFSVAISGIQNGGPDGFALVDGDDNVLQFLSYEGTFTAASGPASGLTSTDIGVAEDNNTQVGQSLQLTGTGLVYEQFDWQAPAAESPGSINSGQVFGIPVDNPPTVASTDPADEATDVATFADVVITFDEEVTFANDAAVLSCDNNNQAYTLTGSDDVYTLAPDADLPGESTCVVTLDVTKIQDVDGNSSDNLADDADDNDADGLYTFSFTTAAPLQTTLISTIQGSGNNVTDDQTIFLVEAVVVGDLQENNELDGFFIQEEDANSDNDILTSEGIFVYCEDDAVNCPDVSQGDLVQVVAVADDAFGMSQLEPQSPSDVSVVGTAALPTAASVSFPVPNPVGGVDHLERFEGMLVEVTTPMAITEYFNYDRFGEMVLFTNGAVTANDFVRPYQFTAKNSPDAAQFQQSQQDFEQSTITLDDGSTSQNPPTLPYPPGGFGVNNSFRAMDVVTGLDGVLNYSFSKWRIHNYDRSADAEIVTDGTLTFNELNPRPTTTPTLPAGNLRVASFNVLNYFNGDGQGGGFPTPRGADTAQEFQRQSAKIAEAICGLDADIVGLNEIENDYEQGNLSAAATLVAGLNASNLCGNRIYDYVDPGQNLGTDQIAVGFIYDTNTVSLLQNANNPAFLDDTASFVTAPVFVGPDTNRVPLAATFVTSQGAELTVLVNHFKSKGGDGTGENADQSDGQGNWNQRRTEASQAILTWIGANPTGSTDPDYMILGDLNAYDEEDPVTTLESDGFTDLVNQFQGDDAYGYVFDGRWGYLDYALANSSLLSQVLGAADWHINADEPDALDYDTTFNPPEWYEQNEFRSSDHDPVIVSLNLIVPASTTIAGASADGVPLSGTLVSSTLNTITVSFSEDIADSDDADDSNNFTNVSNYRLIGAGVNNTLDTASSASFCEGGTLGGDDVALSVDDVNLSGANAVLSLNGGLPLPEGDYALVVCGSTLEDENGSPVNNGDDAFFTFDVDFPSLAVRIDVNRDGIVSPQDVIVVINRLNLQPTGSNAGADVNLDGTIDLTDLNLVINALGQQ